MQTMVQWLNTTLLCLAGLCLMGMVFLACSNMVLRFFGHPVKGTFELMGFLGAMVGALALSGTQAGKGHIVISMFQDRFPARMRLGLDVLTSLICLAFFGLVAWQTWDLALSIREFEEVSETLQIIYYPFVLVVCLGVIALVLQIFVELVLLVGDRSRGGAS
ncbi:TRAP transporter small permease [Desulfoplanes formicivorans]|nr:TRAP transporter small permease [Desulfoplanes formicivorans]